MTQTKVCAIFYLPEFFPVFLQLFFNLLFFEFFLFLFITAFWQNDIQKHCNYSSKNYRRFSKNSSYHSGKVASAAVA